MKHAMTIEDVIKSIEFELAQSAVSRTELGEGVDAVRQYQNKARAEIFTSDKLLKDTRAVVSQQYQINDMHLALLHEMALAIRAMELDVRRLGQAVPRPEKASRGTAAPIPTPAHDATSESPPAVQGVPPPGDEPSLAEDIFGWSDEKIDLAMKPSALTIKMDVRPSTTPLIGGLIHRARTVLHDLTLFYVRQLAQKQTGINQTYGDRLIQLSRQVEDQQQQIEELRAQVLALQTRRSADS
jgi:hypothetical protein